MLAAVRDDVKQRLRRSSFPLEYHAQVIADSRGDQVAMKRLVGFGLAAAIGIFLLLHAAFGSWRLASLVFLTLRFGISGPREVSPEEELLERWAGVEPEPASEPEKEKA